MVRGLAAAGGWLAGCLLQLQQQALWPAGVSAGLALAGALLLWTGRRHAPVLAAGALLLAFALTATRAAGRLADALPAALEGQDLVVTGVVAELPRVGLQGTRFVFEVEAATHQGRPVALPQRLSLGWYRGFDGEALAGRPRPRAACRPALALHGAAAPAARHAEPARLRPRAVAVRTRHCAPAAACARLPAPGADAAGRARRPCRSNGCASTCATPSLLRVHDPAAAGVLAALAVGDQAAIDRDDWDLFRTTGVAHLMSISGLHVTMFAWLAAALVGALWRRSPRADAGRCRRRWRRAGAALAAGRAYALLAGWGVPAQRTVAMIAAVALLRSLGLRWPLPLVLLARCGGGDAARPLGAAAAGLLAVVRGGGPAGGVRACWRHGAAHATCAGLARPHRGSAARRAAHAGRGHRGAGAAVAAVLPAAVAGRLRGQPGGDPAGDAAGHAAGAAGRAAAAAVGAGGMAACRRWPCSCRPWRRLPLPVWTAPQRRPGPRRPACWAALLLVLPLPWRLRLLGLPLLLPLLAPPLERPAHGQFELVAADIGQGTAVLVRTAGHLLVYDTGPAYTPEADAGAARAAAAAARARRAPRRPADAEPPRHRPRRRRGVAAGGRAGAGAVQLAGRGHRCCARVACRTALRSRPALDLGRRALRACCTRPAEHDSRREPNALSCVLRVQGAQRSAAADRRHRSARRKPRCWRAGAPLRSDVLLVPHHGSRTSSTAAFLDAVAPRMAVVQAGYRSRFGHPAPDVVARYAARGIAFVRSDRCGAWTLQADGQGVCQRQTARRFGDITDSRTYRLQHPTTGSKTELLGERCLGADRWLLRLFLCEQQR